MSTLSRLIPRFIKDEIKARQHAAAALAFKAKYDRPSLEETVAGVCDSTLDFCAGQRPGEIIQLLNMLRSDPPKLMGEIGAASGGNLFLFSKVADPYAEILSLELEYTPQRLRAFPRLIKPTQKLICLGGDSHAHETLERVRNILAGRKFDFLFIDGDHSLEGVSKDFDMYAPFVRSGGLIAFHDIVEDAFQRFGRPTPSITGGVPQFWKSLAPKFSERWEFVDDPDQDGFGIGVIRWPG